MSDEATRIELLNAICRDPKDDMLRLVYADWLEENGATESQRAQAEFIRKSVELAQLPEGDERRGGLEARIHELLDGDKKKGISGYRNEWIPDYLKDLTVRFDTSAIRPVTVGFERGFVARLAISAEDLTRLEDRIMTEIPLQHVHVSAMEYPQSRTKITELMRRPIVSRLSTLDITGNYGTFREDIEGILQSPQPLQLEEIHLGAHYSSPTVLQELSGPISEINQKSLLNTKIYHDRAFPNTTGDERLQNLSNAMFVESRNSGATPARQLNGQTLGEIRQRVEQAMNPNPELRRR